MVQKNNDKYFMIMIAKNSQVQNFDDDQFEVPSPEHMRIKNTEYEEGSKDDKANDKKPFFILKNMH